MLSKLFQKWADTILHPNELFKKEKKAKSLSYGAKSLVVAGVITALIYILSSQSALQFMRPFLGMYATPVFVIGLLIVTPVISLIVWLIESAVLYVFAAMLGGKGTFVSQSHALALVNSAFGVLSAVLGLLGLVSIGLGIVVSVLVTLYTLYVLTIALKYIHRYSTANAMLTWLIPLLIVLALLLALLVIIGAALLGLFLSGGLNPSGMLTARI